MDKFLEENRKHWEELASHHPDTDYYDVEAFLDGKCTLDPVELADIGDVEGKTLLHLMCHIGLDALSWARRGARVTGVDFSETAVEMGSKLALQSELDERARFIESDVYELPNVLDEQFDIVYTSIGVLFWLANLDDWAEVITQFVRPGGTFYIAEMHPFAGTFGGESTADNFQIMNPYFRERITYDATEEEGYAGVDPNKLDHGPTHGWTHSLGEVVTALSEAGLRIEFLHEYPWSKFKAVDAMEEREHGRYYLPEVEHEMPFVFTLRAERPQNPGYESDDQKT